MFKLKVSRYGSKTARKLFFAKKWYKFKKIIPMVSLLDCGYLCKFISL